MDEKQYAQFVDRLDNITKLLTTLVVENKSDKEAIFLMSRAAFNQKK